MRATFAAGVILLILTAATYFLLAKNRLAPSRDIAPVDKSEMRLMAERVEVKTKDNFSVVGDHYPASRDSARGLLLLHMMPATRTSWKAFAAKAELAGFSVLAADLRGHGESQGGPEGYKSFSDAEHQASRFDVEAAAEFLKSRGAKEIYLGGASIGANLALQYLAEHPETKAAFLLSPGLDYRGVKTEASAASLSRDQAVYYVASLDDQYSADAVRVLYDATPANIRKEIKLFGTAGHGTAIFGRQPEFTGEVINWLKF